MFRVELVQMDLMNPETFQYRVFTDDDEFVGGFESLDAANDFIVANGGTAVEAGGGWLKSVSNTAGSTYK